MFAKLKKKIEEAEGTDLQKLASSLTSSVSSQIDKRLSLSSVRSTENLASQSPFSKGSTASLASLNSATSPSHAPEASEKTSADFNLLLKEKEEQWKSKLAEAEKTWKSRLAALQQEKDDFVKEKLTHRIILEERNREIASLKEKYSKLEQDFGLLRESENQRNERVQQLEKELETCKLDADCIKRQSDESSKEKDEQIRTLTERLAALSHTSESQSGNGSNATAQSGDDGTLLIRNAELSQQLYMRQQELQRTEQQLHQTSEELNSARKENVQLQSELAEKNQALKLLQQRVSDMKKALQKEIKSGTTISSTNGSSLHEEQAPQQPAEDVNLSYLKHVIFKFLTSREYEAKHLTRAVATLLKFTPEEDKLLKETLEWKTSWFGNRPDLGRGQNALYIPPFP